MAAFDSQKDYYAILEVDPNESPAVFSTTLKDNYRRLARQYHPDTNKNPDAKTNFQNVEEAHRILSDPITKWDYDYARKDAQNPQDAPKEESQDLIQARQDYKKAATEAFRALGLISDNNPDLYDDVIQIRFETQLLNYKDPYHDEGDEAPQRYTRQQQTNVEREIAFFKSLAKAQPQQTSWQTWFQSKNMPIPQERGNNNHSVWPIFRLLLDYKTSTYDVSMSQHAGSQDGQSPASGPFLLNPATMDSPAVSMDSSTVSSLSPYDLLNSNRTSDGINPFFRVESSPTAPAASSAVDEVAPSSPTEFYDQLFCIFKEYYDIAEQFDFSPVNNATLRDIVLQTLDFDQERPKSNSDLNEIINFYRGFLDIQKQKQSILLEICSKNLKPLEGSFVLSDKLLYPSLQPLFTNEKIGVKELTNIKDALNALGSQQLKEFMTRYDEVLRDIAKHFNASNLGSFNSTWVRQFKNLTTSLAEYESGKEIMPLLTVALGEAQTLHRELGLSAGYFINVADFEKQHPSEYRQIFQAITDQNASSENSPPVDQIKLWLQGWENPDDPDKKIELYLKELTQPSNEKTSVAEGDTPLPAAPTPETPSEGVSVPAAGSKAPPSRPRGLLQRILKTLGSAGAFVRKYPLRTTIVGAGVVGLMAAAKNLGSAPVPKPPAAVSTPPTLEAARAAEIEKLNVAIQWRHGHTGPVQAPNEVPLGKLQEYQSLGGKSAVSIEVDGVNVSQGTLNELQSIANQAGIRSDRFQGMVEAYENGYRRFNINPKNHDPEYADEKAKALAASLEAVRDYIQKEQEYRTSFLGRVEEIAGNILPKGAPANAAEGPPMMPSSTAPTHGPSSSGVLGQGFGMVSATMATVQLVSTWKNIDNKERLLLAAQATAGALAAAGKTNPALTSALFVVNTVRASTAEAYETRTTTLATKQEALQSTLATQAGTLGGKAKKYAAVAWNAFQVTGATVSVVQSVAANGVRDFARPEDQKVVQPMMAEKASQARDAVVHQTSQMLTQAQEVTGNAVASTRENLGKLQERVTAFFTQRQAAAAL